MSSDGRRKQKKPTQARGWERRAALITAAEIVLDSTGVSDFSLPRVAEAAHVSKASVYQYFPTRSDLLTALADRHLRRMGAEFVQIYAGPKLHDERNEPGTLYIEMIKSVGSYYARHRTARLLLLGGNPCQKVWETESRNRRILAHGIRSGLTLLGIEWAQAEPDPDPLLIYQGIVNGMMKMSFEACGALPDDALDRICRAALAYLADRGVLHAGAGA